jgi:hypothetical protein
MSDLAELVQFASPRQRDYIEAIIEHGSERKAAKALGVARGSVSKAMCAVKAKAARQGWSPDHDMVKTAPDGFHVKGTSTLYTNGEGGTKIAAQWVKTSIDRERQAEMVREAVDAWCDEAKGAIKPIKPPKHTSDALMTVYPMGDPHFGMYAWAAECGDNFDLDIAERDLCAAIDYLVGQSPDSDRGVLINLGDFFHTDNMDGTTARSGHALDTDGRLQKMMHIGVRALRRCIHRMLEKHQSVEIINVPGNHDNVLALAMNVLFGNVYENEPRVTVHDAPTMRHYVEHGKCLVGAVHGHQTRDRDLPGIMATEKPEEWGRTRFRYFFRGHHHHDSREEFNGCIVEQFRTLAAGDAYAVGSGYLSGRDMKGIVLHKDYGETARFTCGIDLLRSA